MSGSPFAREMPVERPALCPFCSGKIIDTLARVITPETAWRCRECNRTWTIAGVNRAKRL